jgi:CHAT domain-containing protein/predicted negative regulator of RcsB-dependent stress response
MRTYGEHKGIKANLWLHFRKVVKVQMIIVLLVMVSISTIVYSQKNPTNKEQKLQKEIMEVYKTGGQKGLQAFVKKKDTLIDGKFIIRLTNLLIKERNEKLFEIPKITAKEKKAPKTQADVFYKLGEYYRMASKNGQAVDHFDQALQLYTEINDLTGQGNVFRSQGDIHYIKSENAMAFKKYEKALKLFESAGDLKGQGNVYKGKGQVYLFTGNLAKADEMFGFALAKFKAVKDLRGQGTIYLLRGMLNYYTGKIEKALEMYDKAHPFFEKLRATSGLGNIYRSKGDIYFRRGNNPKAQEMYDKALVNFEKAGNLLGQANTLRLKGNIYYYTAQYDKALKIYDEALIFYRKVGELIGQGNIMLRKGEIHYNSGDYARATEMTDKALSLFAQAGDPLGQGNTYFVKGDNYFFSGNNSKALAMYDKAIYYYKKVGDPMGLANTLGRKGNIYFYTGNNLKALEMYDMALPLSEKAGDLMGQGHMFLSRGDIYLQVNNYPKALEMFEQALEFYKRAGLTTSQSGVYMRKGLIYHYQGDNSRAFRMLDSALTIIEKAGSIYRQGDAYRTKGNIYLREGNYSEALKMYDKAFTFYKKEGYPLGMGNVYRKRAEIYFSRGDNPKALELYDKARHLLEETGSIADEAYATHGKATVLAKLGQKDKAAELYKKSIDLLEKVRNQTAISGMKQSFMKTVHEHYGDVALFMLKNKDDAQAFKYSESIKARIFLDSLAEGLVPLEKGIDPELRQKRDNFVSLISILGKKIDQASVEKDEKELSQLKERYRKAENGLDEILIKIRLKNELYNSVRYPAPIALNDLQKSVLKKGELLVSYFVAPEKTYVFLITPKNLKVVALDLKEKEIKGLVKRYLLSVEIENYGDIVKLSKTFYRKLFKPLELSIKKQKDIIIIPDGELAKIPFESYITGTDKSGKPVYLLNRFRIKYVQSATVLAMLRKHYRREGTTKHFIGFGDPVYDYKNFKEGKPEAGSDSSINGKMKGKGSVRSRLETSGMGVKTIAKFFVGQSQFALVHERQEANEENAKSPNLTKFDYIHFACHGVLEDRFQGLALSQLPQSKEDGYLSLNEIMNCDYNAKLVVLSACETGRGKMVKGEGIIGLTRAVMYAGTPAVVASLWKVKEAATNELMIRFYRNMLEKKMDKEEALRRAKLELINSEAYSSPFYWSGFVLYGE